MENTATLEIELSEPMEDGSWRYRIASPAGAERYAVIEAYTGADAECVVPDGLGGVSVKAMGDFAFGGCKACERVVVPDSVESLGRKVFARCYNLRDVHLPANIAELDPQTFEQCRKLERIELPKSLRVLPTHLLYDCPVKKLALPAALERIEERSCNFEKLETLEIDAANPYLRCDGSGLYTADGTELVQMLATVNEYAVARGCTAIAPRVFKGMRTLRRLSLPDSLEVIGEQAFFMTGIAEFEAPASLREIGDRAFASCSMLRRVTLDDGLTSIGDGAFTKTKLERIRIPKTVRRIGTGAFEATEIRFGTSDGFVIDEDNPALRTDGLGLFERREEGDCLVRLMANKPRYNVAEGTVAVADGACAGFDELVRIELPEGIERIGAGAFEGCVKLANVNFPDSLVEIGAGAFRSTKLRSATIGPNVTAIGTDAFACADGKGAADTSAIGSIKVSPENERYYVADGFLCERTEGDAGDVALVFAGSSFKLVVPECIAEIRDLAFNRAHVEKIFVGPSLSRVGSRAFIGIEGLKEVHVRFAEPIDGVEEACVRFPEKGAGRFAAALRMGADGAFFDFAAYDAQVVHEQDAVLATKLALDRLDNPVKLTAESRRLLDAAITSRLDDLTFDLAKSRDSKTLGRLLDHGYLDENALVAAIESATARKEAKAAECLKKLKVARFGEDEE